MSGYFQNFVGFKNRSIPPGVAAAEVKYDSWSVYGDDPKSPAADDTADDTGDDTGDEPTGPRRANALTQRWGDNTSYQVGTNYTELEGDAVTVAVGNSSTKRKGWTNNYTEGPTFSTQIGGTISTSLFSMAVLVGAKVNISAAIEFNMAYAKKINLVMGQTWYVDLDDKKSLIAKSETELAKEKTDFADKVNTVVAGRLSNLASEIDETARQANHTFVALNQLINEVDQKVTTLKQVVGNMDTRVAASWKIACLAFEISAGASVRISSPGVVSID